MDYSIKMWTSQYHREKPMCFSVVRCWRGKKYERVVDVFKDLDKAKSCCEADMSSYDSSIVKKWKMSWEITEMPIKIKLDMDPIDRTILYRNLDKTKYKKICPPRLNSEQLPLYDIQRPMEGQTLP